MTSEVERRPAPVAPAITGPSLRSRIYGFGSIYGKSMRDSRRAVLLIAALMGLLLIGVSFAIVQEFNTPASREHGVRRRDGDGPSTDRAGEALGPPDRPGHRRAGRVRRAVDRRSIHQR